MPELIDPAFRTMPVLTEAQKKARRKEILITDKEGRLIGFRDPGTGERKMLIAAHKRRQATQQFLAEPGVSVQGIVPGSISDIIARFERGEINEEQRRDLMTQLGVPLPLTEPGAGFLGDLLSTVTAQPQVGFVRGIGMGLGKTFGTSILLPEAVRERAEKIEPGTVSEALGFGLVPGATPMDVEDPLTTLFFAAPPGAAVGSAVVSLRAAALAGRKVGAGAVRAAEAFLPLEQRLQARGFRSVQEFLAAEGGFAKLPGRGKPLPAKDSPAFTEALLPDLPKADLLIAEIQAIAQGRTGQLAQSNPILRAIMGRVDPRLIASKPELQYLALYGGLKAMGKQQAASGNAYIASLGTASKFFGKIDDAGRILEGAFKGRQITDLLEKGAKGLNAEQTQFRQRIGDTYRAIERLYERYDIPLNLRPLGPTEQHIGRVWMARHLPDGEMLELAFISKAGRPGTRAGFEKLRRFETAEEAVAAGFTGLRPEEAAFVNLERAYNRVAGKISNDWLLTQIETRTAEMPIGVIVSAERLTKLNEKAIKFKKLINQAARGERTPGGSLSSLADDFPDEAQKFRIALGKESLKERRRLLRDLKAQVNAIITRTSRDMRTAISERAKARELAQAPGFGEVPGITVAPAFSGRIFTGPRAQEIAKTISQGLDPQIIGALRAANAVNSVARYFVLAGDFSVMSIQLLFLAGANPVIYGKSVKGMARAFFDPKFHSRYIQENRVIINEMINSGGLLTMGGMTEFTEAFGRGGILRSRFVQKTPLVIPVKILEPFQRGFEGALDIAGVELWKSLRHLAKNQQDRRRIAAFINSFRGLSDTSAIGIGAGQRGLESLLVLAPRYNRAIASLFIDLFRGDISGSIARRYMAQGVSALVAMNIAINLGISISQGESQEEALSRIFRHLNPTSGDFFTWTVGGQKVGPGSKVRSVVSLVARSAKDPSDVIKLGMENPVFRFLRGNLSLVTGGTIDTLVGRNFMGEPTRDNIMDFGQNILAENLLPIWLQSVLLEGGDPMGRAIRAPFELAGFRTYPTGAWERFKNYAEQQAGKPWDQIDNLERRKLQLTDPEGKKLFKTFTDEQERRGRAEDTFIIMDGYRNEANRKMTEAEVKLADKKIRPSEYKEFVLEQATAVRKQIEGLKLEDRHREVLEQDFSDVPELEFDQIWNRYLEIVSDEALDLGAEGFDFTARDSNLTALRTEVGDEMWGRIEERARISRTELPPEAQRVYQGLDALRPYWDVWKSVVAVEVQALYQAYLDTPQARKDDFLRKNPSLRPVVNRVRLAKERLRRGNPIIDALLVKYYENEPKTTLGRQVKKDPWMDVLPRGPTIPLPPELENLAPARGPTIPLPPELVPSLP